MSTAPPPVLREQPERVAGAFLIALGASAMLGWLTQTPILFEIVRGMVPMVFNTGLSFVLCGVALCLPHQPKRAGSMRRAVALAVATVAALTLLEIVLDLAPVIDFASVHNWHDYGNTRPGRMAPNTALAFLLISFVLLLPENIKSRKTAIAKIALTFAVMTIGVVGLVGYAMAPELLFGWARSARMAVHTATGVIVASAALWLSWSRSNWYASERLFHEGTKIRLLSTAVLVVVTITAGLTGFALLQRGFVSTLESRLATIVKIRRPWLHALAQEVAKSSANAAEAAGLPLEGPRSELAPEPAQGVIDVNDIGRRLLRAGFRGVRFRNSAGDVVASFGSHADELDFDAPLDETGNTALIWDQELRIRTRHLLGPLSRNMTQPARSVELVSATRQLSTLLFDLGGLGPTVQVTACQRHGNGLICLPDALNDIPYTVPLREPPQLLPMQFAFSGTGPGIAHTVDYRGRNVIAAYGLLAPGLGFVAKQDAREAFAPIRSALFVGTPVIAALALAGVAAMFFHLNPLLRRMLRSEQDTAVALAKNLAIRNAVGDGVLTLDADGRIESSNAAAHAMLGLTAAELDGLDFLALLPLQERAQHGADLRSALAGDDADMLRVRDLELLGLRGDGTEFPLELTLNVIPQYAERLFVAVIRDITARRQAEEILSRMAKFDGLTGLPNRVLFQDRLRTALARGVRSGKPVALMFLDLDGFKGINDRFGHGTGDELLKQVASRLNGEVRRTDTVARLGGDEFTIILESMTSPEDAEHLAAKVVRAMQKPFDVDGRELSVTVSVGMAHYDPRVDGSVDVSELLARADHSMYDVKRRGKNGFAVAQGVGVDLREIAG